jgi:hypothetical protein
MDVGDWLRSLGLGQYEALFREKEIDAEVLPELSEADFEKVGIPLGHRKRLVKAIAGLSVVTSASRPPPVAVSGPPADDAERRKLTVMSAISWARPRCPRGSIPKTCAPSLARTISVAQP